MKSAVLSLVTAWMLLSSAPPVAMGQIFSERLLGPPRDPVITNPNAAAPATALPLSQTLPSPTRNAPTPALTPQPPTSQRPTSQPVANQEPLSLSDVRSWQQVTPVSHTDEGPTPLSLPAQAWQRLLDLERENAELSATLHYERKLAEYRQRTDVERQNLNKKIAQMAATIEEDRLKYRAEIARLQKNEVAGVQQTNQLLIPQKTQREQLARLNAQLQAAQESRRQAADVQNAQRTEKQKDEPRHPDAEKGEKQIVPSDVKKRLEKDGKKDGKKGDKKDDQDRDEDDEDEDEDEESDVDDDDDVKPVVAPEEPASPNDQAAATGGVQIFVHQASWIDQ